MVRAILEGRKTQTRRVVKLREGELFDPTTHCAGKKYAQTRRVKCPYGEPGDRLWVRETWWGSIGYTVPEGHEQRMTAYRATFGDERSPAEDGKWRPSIFMPRWASRITLEITAVRVERLQDITEEDAQAEGVKSYRLAWWDGFTYLGDRRMHTQRMADPDAPGDPPADMQHADLQRFEKSALDEFPGLWDQINGKRGYTWDSNPWVWVIEFRRA